jgi:uncharacterized protein (DUF433 family)
MSGGRSKPRTRFATAPTRVVAFRSSLHHAYNANGGIANASARTVSDQQIVDVRRNPRIAGTRITVYAVFEYLQAGWRPEDVAFWLRLTSCQVDAAIRYIEENQADVKAQYAKIMDRINRGNPQELQAKLDATKGRARARLEELRRSKSQESHHEGHSGGQ